MEVRSMKTPTLRIGWSCRLRVAVALCGLLLAALWPCSRSGFAAQARQKEFPTPEAAVQALVDALQDHDAAALLALFGPGSEALISSGDDVRDRANRERFLQRYAVKNSLERTGQDKVVLEVGDDDWPFPIPIVRSGSAWRFDTAAGKEELLNRRIGANELSVIDVLKAYVAAQREYASRDWEGDGTYAYAQRIASTPGKKDGLYWKAGVGGEASPLGPLAAEADREGYAAKKGSGRPVPFHGYYFRILKGQGAHAPGGGYSYLVKGDMILGFAMIAYPARYRSSGVMTFIVNQDGIVYQKDLGKGTAKAAAKITRYDPDKSWKKVDSAAR